MIHVRLFAGAADAAGADTLDVPAAATVDALCQALGGGNALLTQVLGHCSFLVDGRTATREDPLADEARVDVLPPFAGG